jgi:excisionase family DNA binding protein
MPVQQLLDVKLAAERLGTQEWFVRRLVAERRIRFYKIGKYVQFDQTDLEDYVARGKVEAEVDRALSHDDRRAPTKFLEGK